MRKMTGRKVGDKGNQAGQGERDVRAEPHTERSPRPPRVTGGASDGRSPSGWAAAETPKSVLASAPARFDPVWVCSNRIHLMKNLPTHK